MIDRGKPSGAWRRWMDARIAAIESVLGKRDECVGHAVIPFAFGPEIGGGADVLHFRHHVDGVVSVTCDLIGCEQLGCRPQIPNAQGNYELMICHRGDDECGPNIISRLANYTLDAALNPGETMDIGPAAPDGSTITAFLFLDYARFRVRGRDAGLLLCLGITAKELDECQAGKRRRLLIALKDKGIYPFTDWSRQAAL
ncbi:MAG: suppressor of fused domain protein [Planctomycetes bacterium]|nr:suppressor of fused domain protein [Planctomycetota bacterium]